jgi:hypothetical protein
VLKKSYSIKIPSSLKPALQEIRAEFGVPSERQAVAACIATIAAQTRDGSLLRLLTHNPPEPALEAVKEGRRES